MRLVLEANDFVVDVSHDATTALARLEQNYREQEAQEARDALAEAGRRKDQFLATLAHELRNPLAPLLTGLHVLRQGNPAAREQALDTAERQVRHLSRLIDGLLDASRFTLGRMLLKKQRLDLARLVRTVVEDRRPALEQARLTVQVLTPQVPVWVKGDDTRLSQVLHNLIDNAGKFTEAGGTVTVRLVPGEQEVSVAVIDTGIGIDADTLPRLFDVFAQADQTLDRSRGGLGLGLALVKGVIELHGGRVQAQSAGRGQGAEFTFWLRVEPEPAVLCTLTPPAPPSIGQGKPAGPLRVVVIEDNRDAADALCLLLRNLGYEVAAAYTGPDGVRLVE
jgi:signal transduction histidine kinase